MSSEIHSGLNEYTLCGLLVCLSFRHAPIAIQIPLSRAVLHQQRCVMRQSCMSHTPSLSGFVAPIFCMKDTPPARQASL